MIYQDMLLSAFHSLRINLLRSALTMLGIIIGVAAVIIMISIGSGAQQKMDELISSMGSNLLIVVPGTVTAGGARLGHGTISTLTEDDALSMQQDLDSVQVAAPIVRGGAQIVFGNANWATGIIGITPDYLIAREWDIIDGRGFTTEEIKGSAKVALVGDTLIEKLFSGQNPIDQEIRIKRSPFKVIGVLKKKGETTMGQDQDDVILIPISTARKKVLGSKYLSGKIAETIFVKVYSSDLISETLDLIKDLLRQRHRIKPGQDDDFFIRNLAQILDTRAEASRAMAILLAAVASVSLVVGGIGIMNIMLVSVTERTREIGLRMAVGARSFDILMQFLIESITLCLIGGIIGITIGLFGSILITKYGGWPIAIKLSSIILSFCFSAAVGVFFGFYPARKASRLDPIEALRYE